jgi:thymidylate synthase
MNQEEQQYIDLIENIFENGTLESTRNGNTKAIFGNMMRFSLKDGQIPILTTKKTAWKTCLKELLWFIQGHTDNKLLKNQNVHIWDANGSREFLDSRNLTNYEEDELGPIYGFQWRHFNAPYTNSQTDYSNQGIDQLMQAITMLKDPSQRTSRRIIVSAWNPCQLDEMALPPCHVLFQFHVKQNKYLSCSLYQRSGDVGLGVPFNIASYSFLVHIIAKHCDLEPDEFVYFLGNAHIYENHFDALQTQIKREPKPFPKISIKNKHENIDDYTVNDIEFLTEYTYHDSIKMKMSA